MQRKFEELVNKAYYLVEQQQYERALDLLHQAESINESFAPAHNELCVVYTKLGHYNEAYLHAMRAIELDPNNPKYHNSLSSALYDLGRFQEALNSAKTAISLDQMYPSAYMALSHILRALKAPQNKITEVEELGKALYNTSKYRGDGTPLRDNDLKEFFKLIDISYIKKQPQAEFDARGFLWALNQIGKDPGSWHRSTVVKEAIILPLVQWCFTIIAPLAGLFGYLRPNFSVTSRKYYLFVGISLIIYSIAFYTRRTSHLMQNKYSRTGNPINPHSIKIVSGLIKGFGLSLFFFGSGSFFDMVYSTYTVVIGVISLMIITYLFFRA